MVRKICNIISTLLVILVVILAILLVGVRVVGYTPYAVLSPSMTPLYYPGDLVYVKSTDSSLVVPGDVITFVIKDNTTVTHRVVRYDEEKNVFITKGDANDIEDTSPVMPENLVGVVKFSIPKLGYVSNFLMTAKGKYIMVISFCVIALLFILPEFFKKSTDKTA